MRVMAPVTNHCGQHDPGRHEHRAWHVTRQNQLSPELYKTILTNDVTKMLSSARQIKVKKKQKKKIF